MEKILIIDHDFNNQSLLVEIIKEAFPDSLLFNHLTDSGEIDVALAKNPDVILLNLTIGQSDGPAICRKIKQNKRSENIPVLGITFRDKNEIHRNEALESGVEAFVYLPFDKIELTAQIRAMLKIRSANKQNQEWLLENEEKYRRIFENIQDVYYEASLDGIITEVSPSIEIISYGQYKRNDLIGSSISAFYAYAEDRELFLSFLYQKGRVNDFELALFNKDGSIIMCAISAKICLDSKGVPEKIIGNLHDISRRKQTEAKLKESEAQFRDFFERAPDPIFIADIESGLIVDTNEAATVLLMLPHEKIVGLHQSMLHPPRMNEFSKAAFHHQSYQPAQQISSHPVETTVLRSDGTEIPVEVVSSRIKIKGRPSLLGIFRDLTERKHAEEKLNESQLRYKLVFENSGTINLIFDANCRLLLQNDQSAKIIGREKRETIGKTALEIFGISTGSTIMEQMNHVMETGITEEFEILLDMPDGKRWFHSIYQPIINEKKQIEGLQIVSHDITTQKQIELALIKSETLFRILSENSLTGIYTISNDRLQYINPAFANIFGYTQDELTGADTLAVIHPADRQLVAENIRRRMEGEISSLKYEFRGLKKNGDIIYILVLGGMTTINNNPVLVGNILDITERKLAEELLEASQKRISEILESITDGFVAFDAKMNYTYINARGAALFGLKPEDLIGKNYWKEFPDAKGTPFANNYLHVLETRTSLVFEDYYEPWDRWFENRIYPTHGGIAVYYSETTERKRTERALIESNEFNKTLIRTIPFGMDIVDEEGNILFMSENFEKEFGKGAIGKKCWSVYRDNHQQCSECPLLAGISVGETSLFETSGVMENKTFQISHTGMMFREKKAMLEIFQDITRKKEIEKKVKLLAQSLESISECVTITDLNDIIIYVNESLLHTYQYMKAEVIGKHISILRTPEENYYHARNILPRTMEGGWRGEIINVKKDGTRFPILLSTSVIKDESEAPIAMIGVAIDITEISKNRDELVAAKEKAEEINRLKSAFLGNMSHEIRTPMNAIIGFSDLMAEADVEEKNVYAEIINKSSIQLLSLIDDVILFSRLQSEKMPVQITEFYPSELIRDVHQMFNHPEMNNGLAIGVRIPENLKNLIITSDANKVKQILTNLTSNAVKYTFEGSIEIGFDLHNGQIEFYVKDTGIGISEKEQQQIFEIFYRGEQALSCAIRGTGLGLNIAKELVTVIGGTIGVVSKVNNGSRFYFSLPVEESLKKDTEHQSNITELKNLSKFSILIADDEPINSQYLEAILKGIFKRIDHARNGMEAVEMVSINKYDLILMDLKMPVMGGIEAAKIIREKFPEIPIIAQTAYTLPEEKELAYASGCTDFISKPIRKEVLMKIINKYISDYQ